jgi:hypothetical protein
LFKGFDHQPPGAMLIKFYKKQRCAEADGKDDQLDGMSAI